MYRDIQHGVTTITAKPIEEQPYVNRRNVTNFRMEFYNTIRKTVFWRDSRGVTVSETANVGQGVAEALYITLEYEFVPSSDFDFRELVASLNFGENSTLKKEIYNRLNVISGQSSTDRQRRFRITLGVTAKELDEAGGVVYLRDLDLLIGYDILKEQVLHPYSNEGMLATIKRQINYSSVGVNLRFMLVDNTGRVEPVWYNNGVTTIELKRTRDSNLEDGLYVFYSNSDGDEIQSDYLALIDAKAKYHLFATRTEAINYGKPERVLEEMKRAHELDVFREKRELSELEAAIKREKAILDRDKANAQAQREEDEAIRKQAQIDADSRAKRLTEEHQRQMAQLTAERERFEWERNTAHERMRFEQEMNRNRNKDSADQTKAMLDILKVAIGLVGPMLTAYVLYKGVSNGKK